MTQEHAQTLAQTIAMCEESIDACQNLIDMCSLSNTEECSKSVGIIVATSNKAIQACHTSIVHSETHLKSCTIERCKQACLDCITACTQAIIESQVVIKECSAGNEECIPSCVNTIQAYSECAQACETSKTIGSSF